MSSSQKLYQEALSLFKTSRFIEAIQNLESLLRYDSTYEDAYEALAICYSKVNRLDDAIEVAKGWIRLNPLSKMAHANLSRFYAAKGLIAEAEHEQAEARRLGWIEELREKKMKIPTVDPQEKVERFKKVIELDPRDILGYYSLGEVYLENGMFREAVETFSRGLGVDPRHSSSYLGLGQAYQTLGEIEKAKATFVKGIALAEEQGEVMTQKKMEARLRQLSSNPS